MAPPVTPTTGAAPSARRVSKRLVFSYVLDWLVIIAIAAAGGGLYKIVGSEHAFALQDPRISYPLVPNTVSITVVGLIALAAPGIIIAAVSLLIPARSLAAGTPTAILWRRRLWEWNAGWLGLGLSLAGAFFVTSGLKDVVGKPRPDLLARCDPDIANVAAHIVGGLGLHLEEAPIVVSSSICRNTDLSILNDGFASFPSGHSSFSWAGLLYLSLWLCAKFAIAIPFLHHQPARCDNHGSPARPSQSPSRNQAAAPPLYLLLLALAPIAAAIYVCSSRWADYQHEGFDIIAGAAIGAFFAWLGFRWYHLPIRPGSTGDGGAWSWGPRSRDRAFYVGFGAAGFAGEEGWESAKAPRNQYEDLELGVLTAGVNVGRGEGETQPAS